MGGVTNETFLLTDWTNENIRLLLKEESNLFLSVGRE